MLCAFLPPQQGVVFPLELIKNEAQVVVSIGKIKGVPDPSTLQELEIGSEAPVITYSYCVTYKFAGEETEDVVTEVGA